MAHFAKLDTDNRTVLLVVPLADDKCGGGEDEAAGIAYLNKVHNWPNWKRTSYNTRGNVHLNGGTPFRGNFAGIGGIYDSENDVFLEAQPPYPSWILNTSTWLYEAPVALPTQAELPAGVFVQGWDEENQQWLLTTPE